MLRIAGISKPKRSVIFLPAASLTLLIFCVGCYGQFEKSMHAEDVSAQTSTDDFYAYYTRLDYKIPVEQALDYIPMEDEDDEGQEDEEEYESDGEERWKGSDPITGRYADIIVNVSKGRQFVFGRESSYLPFWKTEKGKWFVEDLIDRQNDIACVYSFVRIIEAESDRALIHWRYIPDIDNPHGFMGVGHEYFEIFNDGKIIRRVRKAASNLDDYNDRENVIVQTLSLKPEGIEQVSLQQAKLSKRPVEGIKGSQAKTGVVDSPAAWWKFDEGLNQRTYAQRDITKESMSGRDCARGR